MWIESDAAQRSVDRDPPEAARKRQGRILLNYLDEVQKKKRNVLHASVVQTSPCIAVSKAIE